MCNQLEQLKKEQLNLTCSPGSESPSPCSNVIKTVDRSNNNCSSNNHHRPHNLHREGNSKKGNSKGRLGRMTNHFVEEMISSDLSNDEQVDIQRDSNSLGPCNGDWEVLALNISPDLGKSSIQNCTIHF